MVEAALEKTGYQMYRDVAIINVPDLVIMKTHKETIVMMLDQMKSIAEHAYIEEVALSIMFGEQILQSYVFLRENINGHISIQPISNY